MASNATTEIKTRPVGGQQPTTHWGSTKRQRTLSMSDKGWDVACTLAETTRTNRSEICEVALRVLAIALENGDSFDQLRKDSLARDSQAA
ncbi:MAG: hypothetical protein ACO23G_14405 [Limnohabitans sp.]